MAALSTQHSLARPRPMPWQAALSTDLVILCEQQREHVFSIGLAQCGTGFQPVFLLNVGPTAAFSIRAAKNVIAAWRRKTGIAQVVFVPADLEKVMSHE